MVRVTVLFGAMIALACSSGITAAQPSDATGGAFDGTYLGSLTLTKKGCNPAGAGSETNQLRLPVKNGAFPWTINKVRTMVPIGKDGEIAMKTPYIELRGKAVGKVMEWDSINNNCFNKWHFEKQ